MTPLDQLTYALLESTAPVTEILDDVELAPAAEDIRPLVGSILAPLEALFAPRDLLTATAVLEAATPLLMETVLLVPNGRPV
jgi:hypothetical protein